jgi:hypothetical protein
MSVTNGQNADQIVFNGAFVSKLVNSTVISRVTLNRTGSGAQVVDTQQTINDSLARLTVTEADVVVIEADIVAAEGAIVALQLINPLSNLNATVDPLSSNDNIQGYAVGSRWFNVTNDRVFACVDSTTALAIWKRLDKERLAVSFFNTLDMSSNNISDAGYTQLVADTGAVEIKKINAFYPAGSILIFAVGAASSEVDDFILQPGGGEESVSIPPNSRVSLTLVSGQTTITSGVLAVNFLTEV